MEKKLMTPVETWEDFWAWVKTTPDWDLITREEKQYLDKTNRQAKIGKVGARRMNNIFDKHCRGRYKMLLGFEFEKGG